MDSSVRLAGWLAVFVLIGSAVPKQMCVFLSTLFSWRFGTVAASTRAILPWWRSLSHSFRIVRRFSGIAITAWFGLVWYFPERSGTIVSLANNEPLHCVVIHQTVSCILSYRNVLCIILYNVLLCPIVHYHATQYFVVSSNIILSNILLYHLVQYEYHA